LPKGITKYDFRDLTRQQEDKTSQSRPPVLAINKTAQEINPLLKQPKKPISNSFTIINTQFFKEKSHGI
jgi:hypothetical protein